MKLQFRLRTLMIAVTLLAVPLGYVGWQAKIVRERKALADKITQTGGDVLFAAEASQPMHRVIVVNGIYKVWGFPSVPRVRAWKGDDAAVAILLPIASAKDDLNLAKEVFPEAEIGIKRP